MTKTKTETFEPREDEAGRTRLDRPLSPEEAATLEEERAKAYREARERRFAGRGSDGRAPRS